MSDANKKTLKQFGKVTCAMIIALIIIITNVEIWNMFAVGSTDVFHLVVSIINIVWEVVVSALFFKKFMFKKEEQ